MIKSILYNDEEQLRPAIAYSIIGACCLVIGYFVYAAWAGANGQLEANLLCITEGCGYADNRKLEVGELFPAECPKCGKKSVYYALKCPKCSKPTVMNEVLGKTGPTRCSKCGAEVRHGGN